jgi:hypothetical protein
MLKMTKINQKIYATNAFNAHMFLSSKSLQMLKMPLNTRKTQDIHNAEML